MDVDIGDLQRLVGLPQAMTFVRLALRLPVMPASWTVHSLVCFHYKRFCLFCNQTRLHVLSGLKCETPDEEVYGGVGKSRPLDEFVSVIYGSENKILIWSNSFSGNCGYPNLVRMSMHYWNIVNLSAYTANRWGRFSQTRNGEGKVVHWPVWTKEFAETVLMSCWL